MNAPRDLSDLHVLIVDDDDDQRDLVTRLFEQAGATKPATAADATEALRACAATPPHLIVLDLAMPGRSGFDVLPDLLERAPGALVVILSNLPRRRLAAHLERRGAVGFVEKRVPPSRLVAEILIAAALIDLTRRHVIDLADGGGSTRASRHFVTALLGDDDRAFTSDVELVVSELVANAIGHARSDARLEVRITPDILRVEVYDDDPTLPLRRTPDFDRPGGRGLHILDALATRWGATPLTNGGKVVWIELKRPTPSTPAPHTR